MNGRQDPGAPKENTVRLRGQVDHITFQNPENGFTIARLQPETEEGESTEPVTVVGPMTVSTGETVLMEGEWVTHPKFGRQLQVSTCLPADPVTVDGIRRYLGSGLIKGIGPVMAERIVERFGVDALEVIDSQPRRLLQVSGLGRKRIQAISEAWKEQRRIRDVMVFLQSHGVGTGHALRIYKEYGDEAIEMVRQDPYRLQRDVRGIGFQTADSIAADLGVARDAPERVRAGVRYVLAEASDDGHVFVPTEGISSQVRALLEIDDGLVPAAIQRLQKDEEIIVEGGWGEDSRCYLRRLHRAETGVARALQRLLETAGPPLVAEAEEEVAETLDLGADQLRALEAVAQSKVVVVTGGPGTGKTTVTRQIVSLLEGSGLRVLLCSPTGRAAKRLAEATSREARTIHRVLEFAPNEGGFRRDENLPLETDALIVDEGSMIDISLMYALLRAVPDHARLILVGDIDQLPSVGPGYVMGDIIASDIVSVARLRQIYRQAGDSRIVANAHRINEGEWPQVDNDAASDFFFVEEDDPERVAQRIEDLVARRLPKGRGLDPLRQIQVLSPMYKGQTGALSLNRRLQERLNPGRKAHVVGDRELREGDRVMQVRNNYDKGVFNGDLGRIGRLEKGEDEAFAEVVFEDGVVQRYEFNQLDQLALAYAISIHRSQGSEFPAVVMPLTTQHYPMLQRNLLYTGVTRARDLFVLVGSKRALKRAIDNDQQANRFTSLAERLRG
ncbi:MAG TPA: ATP-dependent RecD-like DNA helicase [Candidatus Latescibacteria bacterium]|nr:ATP-dependent RecD-like DNA helicase [Candidatus Latescibacterota bacterium]HJP34182.1 ATP-dependent RecD-like DNA helicase [Candidatus Latescibacterota bacterium]